MVSESVSRDELATADPAAPVEDPRISLLQREPVLLLVLSILLPALSVAVERLIAGEPVAAAVLAGVSVLIGVLGRLVRQAVTPVAAPRLDRETPLIVPAPLGRERIGL